MYLISWHGKLVGRGLADGDLRQLNFTTDLQNLRLFGFELATYRSASGTDYGEVLSRKGNRAIQKVDFIDGDRFVNISMGGVFLTAEPDGSLVWDRKEAHDWEKFLTIDSDELDGLWDILHSRWSLNDGPTMVPGDIEIRSDFKIQIGADVCDLIDIIRSMREENPPPYVIRSASLATPLLQRAGSILRRGTDEPSRIRLVPDQFSIAFREASRQVDLGNFRQALENLDLLRERYPGYDEIDRLHGLILNRQRKSDFKKSGVYYRRDLAWEGDWLRYLLPQLQELRSEAELVGGEYGTVVVVDNLLTPERALLYKSAYLHGVSIVLVHLSDEGFHDDLSAYAWCKFVFRNYAPVNSIARNVEAFPLGYKTGFNSGILELAITQRPYVWSFAGDPSKTERSSMLLAMRTVYGGFEHLTGGFNSADALPVSQYSALMHRSVFIPCPRGFVNFDTFRIYEALEAGCIPIVERNVDFDYFDHAFGETPFLRVINWLDAPVLINEVLESGEMEQLAQRCLEWWKQRKSQVKLRFSEIIRTV